MYPFQIYLGNYSQNLGLTPLNLNAICSMRRSLRTSVSHEIMSFTANIIVLYCIL